VLRLDPANVFGLENRGLAHHMAGRLDAAIADYGAALRLEKDRPFALYGRGLARKARGDTAGGEADIAAAKAQREDIAKWLAIYGLR